MTYKHNGSADGSYLGDRLVLLGIDEEAKIVFFEHQNDLTDISYARDNWDEGWIYQHSIKRQIALKAKLDKKN